MASCIIDRSIPLAVGRAVAAELRRRLVFGGRRHRTVVVGGVRRGVPVSKDIDLLVIVSDDIDFRGVLASATLLPAAGLSITAVRNSGPRRASLVVKNPRQKYYTVDLFLATKKEEPFALFHYVNEREYNIRVRAHAKRRGYRLNQYGVFIAETNRRAPGSSAIKTERDLARFLGVTYK